MEKWQRHILLLATASGVVVLLGNLAFDIQTNQRTLSVAQYLLNLPVVILFAFVDLLIVGYFNRSFRFRHHLFVRGFAELIATSIPVAAATIGLNMLLNHLMGEAPASPQNYVQSVAAILPVNVVLVLLIELLLHYERQAEHEREKMRYQYNMLKAQMDPHFLFNSLNILAALAFEDPDRTNRFAKQLSLVYRYVLTAASMSTIALSEELIFIRRYIFLLETRFGDAIDFSIDETKGCDGMIVPISLQVAVENAVKHNIATAERRLAIRIEVDQTGVTVHNNVQLRPNVERGGFGLRSLWEQYKLLGKEIELHSNDEEFSIRIPFI